MHPDHIETLLNINRQFYATFGRAFADTRRRIQPGVRRVLENLPPAGRWLDVGCGSGALAAEWARLRCGAYLGLDFSHELLAEARQALAEVAQPQAAVQFAHCDLSAPGWADDLPAPFDGVLCFAVLHHIPDRALRCRLLHAVHRLLQGGDHGYFIHSVWQYQHSPRLLARCLPWQTVGLDETDLDPGDTLLDWRYAPPGQSERHGLRYVHLFSRPELDELAAACGFRILESFESDGQGGRLGLYQLWQAI